MGLLSKIGFPILIIGGAVAGLIIFKDRIAGAGKDAGQSIGSFFGSGVKGIGEGFQNIFTDPVEKAINDFTNFDPLPKAFGDSQSTSNKFVQPPVVIPTEEQLDEAFLGFKDVEKFVRTNLGQVIDTPIRTSKGSLPNIFDFRDLISGGKADIGGSGAIGLFDFADTPIQESVPLSQEALNFFKSIGRKTTRLL